MSTDPGPLPRRGGILTTIFLVAVGVAVIVATVMSLRDDDSTTAAEAVQSALDQSTTESSEEFQPPGGPLAGTAATDFELTLLSGETFDLSDHFANDGRPLVLNFWASWCAPCRAEMPDFDTVASERGDVLIVGIRRGQAPTKGRAAPGQHHGNAGDCAADHPA